MNRIFFWIGAIVSLAPCATMTSFGLGNSLMDELDGMPAIAQSKGDVLTHDRHSIPGCGMQCLWSMTPGLPDGFAQRRLDCLLAEAFCNGAELNIDGDSKYMGYYYDASLAVNSNCRLLVFTQWISKDQNWGTWDALWPSNNIDLCPKYGTAAYHEGLVRKLQTMYPTKEVCLIPIGHIMYLFDQKARAGQIPGYSDAFGLYADGIHLNAQGKYLQNLAAYAVMFKKDPHGAGLSYGGTGDPQTTVSQSFADLAYDLVWQVVTQLNDLTHVGTSTGSSVGALLTTDKTSGAIPLTVSFDGSQSSGANLTYAWRFGDGGTSTQQKPQHTYTTVGSFTAVLTVASGSNKDSVKATITVIDPATSPTEISCGKAVIASSEENSQFGGFLPAINAVDCDPGTRWSSNTTDNEWIYIDLGSPKSFGRVILRWEAAYGAQYKIQVSNDAQTWADLASVTNGNGGDDTLAVNGNGRYVRMLGITRGTGFGYSLWEFEVYQMPGATAIGPAHQKESHLLSSGTSTAMTRTFTINGVMQQMSAVSTDGRVRRSSGIVIVQGADRKIRVNCNTIGR